MSKERLEALASLERELIELEAEEENIGPQSIDDRLKSLEESVGDGEDLDGEIKISISSDRTMAYLTFTRHKVGGNPVTYEKIIEALMDEDIKGIDEEVIKKALKEEQFDQSILVAKGIAPEKGRNGYFTYLFKIASQEMLGEREEPKVISEKVFAGQILAIRVPATQGRETGVSVTGEDLPPQRGDEIIFKARDGVELIGDGLVALATTNGKVSWLKNSVGIEEEESPAGTTPSVVIAQERETAEEEGARILGLTIEEIEAVEVRPDEFRIFHREAAYRPWEKMPSKEKMEDFEKDLFGEEEAEEEVDEADQEEGSEESENLDELILAFKEDESLDVEDIERSLEGIKRGEGLDGEIEISISPDKTKAYLLFTQNKIGGKPVTYDKITKALKEEDIKNVDEEAIRKALDEEKFNEEILVAKGIAPQKGEDGYFTYLFGTALEEMLKEEEEVKEGEKTKEEVEKKEGEKVFAGQILAERVAATEGKKSGLSVAGEELPPQRGSEIETKAGDGVKLSEDGLTTYSTANGSVCWLKNSVRVEGEKTSTEITHSVVISAELDQAKEEGAEILGLSLEEVAAKEEGSGKFRIFPKEAVSLPWQKKKLSAEEKLEAELFGELDEKEAGEGKAEEAAKEGETPSEEGEEGEEIANGMALVEITPDGGKANITLIPPQGGGLPLAFKDCLNALEENGVRAGIKEDVIREALKENIFHIPLLVAEEIPAEQGVDAQTEYKFDIEEKIRFKENEEGRIDLRQLNLIQNVRVDDLLAVKVPAKRG
ncbi:FapA family protein, partial [bacterium]|nr:FapA family protein [bacterium]